MVKMEGMKVVKLRLRPRTELGKFSMGAFFVFALALLLRILQSEFTVFQTRIADSLEILYFFLEYISGALAWLTGLISILASKERSIIILGYTLAPLVIIIFISVSN